jgi:hypothetical protein
VRLGNTPAPALPPVRTDSYCDLDGEHKEGNVERDPQVPEIAIATGQAVHDVHHAPSPSSIIRRTRTSAMAIA